MTAFTCYIMRYWKSSFFVAAASVAIGVTIGLLIIEWIGVGPSVVTDATPYELDGTVQIGGHIDILYDVDRRRTCLMYPSRSIWRWMPGQKEPTQQFFSLGQVPPVLTQLGHQRVVLSLPLPAGVVPDHWFYRSTVIEQCGWLPAFSPLIFRTTPDIPIEVVP